MTEDQPKPPSIWTPAFVTLVLINFVTMIGQFASMTVLPLFARDLGASASLIGFVTGSFAITALAVRPFFGPAIDSFSKKRLLLVIYVILGVAYFSYAFATTVSAVIAIRFVNGIGIGCSSPLVMALASDELPQERMSSGIGFFTVASAGAQAVGPAFGIEMSRAIGYGPTFLIIGGLLVVSIVSLTLFVHERPNPDRPPYQIRLDRIFAKQAIVPAIVLFLLSVSFSCTSAFMAIYGGLNGITQISLYFALYAVMLLGTRPLFGWLSERFGTTKIFLLAMACFAASYVIVSFANSLPFFLLAAVVAGCGYGASTPLMHSLTFRCVPRNRRGAGSNTNYTGLDAGTLIGPNIGGFAIEAMMAGGVAEVAAYSRMWLVMIAPVVLAVIIYLAQAGKLARYQAEVAQEG